MKCKTMLKFLLCFFIISVFCGTYLTYAAGPSASWFFTAGSSTKNNAINSIDGELAPVKHIQSLIMYMGIIAAVVVTAIYSIQWMLANSAKRQELKAGMWSLVIGVVLLVIGPKLAIMIYNTFLLDASTSVEHVEKVGSTLVDIIQAIGYVVAVVMTLIVGVQWMTATSSKRQELKGKMINILVGAVLLVAGVSILGVVEDVATNVKDKNFASETLGLLQTDENIKIYKV